MATGSSSWHSEGPIIGNSQLPSKSENNPSLPAEVLENIFSYLAPADLSALTKSSRALYRIATSAHLWERPYFAYWREGDQTKEKKRRTTISRQKRRIEALRALADYSWTKRGKLPAAERSDGKRLRADDYTDEACLEDVPTTEASSSTVPFPRFLSTHPSILGKDEDGQPPSFYHLFRERMGIDQEILDIIERQCTSESGYLHRAERIARIYGNDAKDVLHALVSSQQRSDPSQDNSGRNAPSFPRAFELRKAELVRSHSHHLTILHYAQEILEHLQVKEAMSGLTSLYRSVDLSLEGSSYWTSLSPMCRETSDGELKRALSSKHFETAACWLSMFMGGEGLEITEELDVLAISCALYLREAGVSLDDDNQETFALAILRFMKHRGFRGASFQDFHRLENNFLHLCLDERGRRTLPLTLTVIFCSLACRLGLPAMLANIPGRIVAIIEPAEAPRNPGKRFWVDIYGGGVVLNEENIRTLLENVNAMDTNMAEVGMMASDAVTITVRAARNVLNSAQRMRGPRNHSDENVVSIESVRENRVAHQGHPATDPTLTSDELFEKLAYAPNFSYTPRRTFLSQTSRLSSPRPRLCDPFELDETECWAASGHGRYQPNLHSLECNLTAAMHGASHAMVRLHALPVLQHGAAGANWLASLAKASFPLDVLIIEKELTGREPEESNVSDTNEKETQISAPPSEDDSQRSNESHNTIPDTSSPLYVQDEDTRESLTRGFADVRLAFQGDIPDADRKRRDQAMENVDWSDIHPVGTVFVHRTYGYKAVIKSWDVKCNASRRWIEQMGVASLPGGDRQPFYASLVDDGSQRYVAHCNIIPAVFEDQSETSMDNLSPRRTNGIVNETGLKVRDIEPLLRHRGIGELFRCVNSTALSSIGAEREGRRVRLVRNERGRAFFPDDGGDEPH